MPVRCVDVRIGRQLTGLLTGQRSGCAQLSPRCACVRKAPQRCRWNSMVQFVAPSAIKQPLGFFGSSKGLCRVKEKAPNSQFRGRLAHEHTASEATGFLFVALDRFEEEALLIAEGGVEAWRRDVHRLREIAYRCSLIAPAPEQTDGTFECFSAIEPARPAALFWRCCHVILSDRYINLLTGSRKYRYFCSGH